MGEPKGIGHGIHHLDLFPDGIAQGEVGLGKQDGEGNARESSAGPHIENAGAGLGPKNPADGQAVEDVPGEKRVDVFARNHIDAGVPFPVQPAQLGQLMPLVFGGRREGGAEVGGFALQVGQEGVDAKSESKGHVRIARGRFRERQP